MTFRSYADWLRSRGESGLIELVRLRPDLLHPPPEDIADLAARAATPSSVGRALRHLNAWQAAVLEAVAAAPSATPAEVSTLLAGPAPDQLEQAFEDLRHHGLLWGEPNRLRLLREARVALGPTPGGLGAPSADPISDERIDSAMAETSQKARDLVDRLLWGPSTGRVTAAADRDRTTPVGELVAAGLLRIVDADTVEIPREVAWRLREPRQLHRELATPTAPDLASGETDSLGLTGLRARLAVQTAVATATELVHDVEACVEWISSQSEAVQSGVAQSGVAQSGVALLRDGGMAARTFAGLRAATSLTPQRAGFAVELAVAAGLLVTQHHITVTTAYDLWLTEPTVRRWQTLSRAWVTMGRWPAHGLAAGAHVLGESADLPSARDLRTATVAALAALGPNVQIGQAPDRSGALVDLLAWQRPGRARMPWPLTELVTELWSELHSIGLLRDDGVTTILLPPPGSEVDAVHALPDEVVSQFAEPVAEVILQADLTAVAPGQLTAEVARTLRVLADQESRGAGAVFRFTAVTMRRAFDAGWSADEIRTWLTHHSVTPVPQPLDYLIDDTARLHGSVRVGTAWCYVRTDDEAQARAVASRPEARALGLRQIAPGVLVAEAEPDQVVALLRTLGLHPAAEDAQGRTVTAPDPVRASTPRVGAARPEQDPSEVVRDLLARDLHRAEAARAVTDALTTVRTAHAERSWIRLTYVGDDGTSHHTVARPVTLGSGLVRISGPDGTHTLPLARVVSAVPAETPSR